MEKIRASLRGGRQADEAISEIASAMNGLLPRNDGRTKSSDDIFDRYQKIHAYFSNLIDQKQFDPKSFKSFSSYWEWLSLMISLDSSRMFDELSQLTQLTYERFSNNESQKKLIELSQSFKRFQRMISIQLTQEDWQKISKDSSSLTLFTRNDMHFQISDSEMTLLHEAQSSAQHFYELAEKRNEVFADRIEQEMNRKKKDISIIVLGGFHEKGLKAALEAKGIATSVISPKINEALTDIPYFERMIGKPTQLESVLIQASTLESALKISGIISENDRIAAGQELYLLAAINRLLQTPFADWDSLVSQLNEALENVQIDKFQGDNGEGRYLLWIRHRNGRNLIKVQIESGLDGPKILDTSSEEIPTQRLQTESENPKDYFHRMAEGVIAVAYGLVSFSAGRRAELRMQAKTWPEFLDVVSQAQEEAGEIKEVVLPGDFEIDLEKGYILIAGRMPIFFGFPSHFNSLGEYLQFVLQTEVLQEFSPNLQPPFELSLQRYMKEGRPWDYHNVLQIVKIDKTQELQPKIEASIKQSRRKWLLPWTKSYKNMQQKVLNALRTLGIDGQKDSRLFEPNIHELTLRALALQNLDFDFELRVGDYQAEAGLQKRTIIMTHRRSEARNQFAVGLTLDIAENDRGKTIREIIAQNTDRIKEAGITDSFTPVRISGLIGTDEVQAMSFYKTYSNPTAVSGAWDLKVFGSSLRLIYPRSETRAVLVPETYQQMSPFDFLVTQLQFEKLEGRQERRRRLIIDAFDSVHMEKLPDIFANLWEKWPEQELARPSAILLQRYIGIGGFDFFKKGVNPKFLQIMDRYGLTMQTVIRGRHENVPDILLPAPFVDPQTVHIAELLKTESRSKILKRMGNALAQLFPGQQSKMVKDIFRNVLALGHPEGPSSMVWLYSSDYGQVEVVELLIRAMEKAQRLDPERFAERNLVLFTRLARGKKYIQYNPDTQQTQEFFYHDQLLDYLQNLHNEGRVFLYDFQNPKTTFFPPDALKTKIYVVNLPTVFSGTWFDTTQNLTDIAVFAGDMGFRQMFTLPRLGVGPVQLPDPHPYGQRDMQDQLLEVLKQNAYKAFGTIPQSVANLMDLLRDFLTIQDPNFTPDHSFVENLSTTFAHILVDREGVARYRNAESYLLDSGRNAFNFLINLFVAIDRGKTIGDIKRDPALIPFEPDLEVKPKGKFFRRNFLVPIILKFNVGFGDSTFVRQIMQAVEIAGANIYQDVAILLLDPNLEDLVIGLQKFENAARTSGINFDRLRFILPQEDSQGKIRLHFLKRKPGAEPLSELIKRLRPDGRSETRSIPAETELYRNFEWQPVTPGSQAESNGRAETRHDQQRPDQFDDEFKFRATPFSDKEKKEYTIFSIGPYEFGISAEDLARFSEGDRTIPVNYFDRYNGKLISIEGSEQENFRNYILDVITFIQTQTERFGSAGNVPPLDIEYTDHEVIVKHENVTTKMNFSNAEFVALTPNGSVIELSQIPLEDWNRLRHNFLTLAFLPAVFYSSTQEKAIKAYQTAFTDQAFAYDSSISRLGQIVQQARSETRAFDQVEVNRQTVKDVSSQLRRILSEAEADARPEYLDWARRSQSFLTLIGADPTQVFPALNFIGDYLRFSRLLRRVVSLKGIKEILRKRVETTRARFTDFTVEGNQEYDPQVIRITYKQPGGDDLGVLIDMVKGLQESLDFLRSNLYEIKLTQRERVYEKGVAVGWMVPLKRRAETRMLVLSRKVNEEVRIGEDVFVRVTDTKPLQLKIVAKSRSLTLILPDEKEIKTKTGTPSEIKLQLGERVRIEPNIAVSFIDIKSGTVKLGFEAPTDIEIMRTELLPSPPVTPISRNHIIEQLYAAATDLSDLGRERETSKLIRAAKELDALNEDKFPKTDEEWIKLIRSYSAFQYFKEQTSRAETRANPDFSKFKDRYKFGKVIEGNSAIYSIGPYRFGVLIERVIGFKNNDHTTPIYQLDSVQKQWNRIPEGNFKEYIFGVLAFIQAGVEHYEEVPGKIPSMNVEYAPSGVIVNDGRFTFKAKFSTGAFEIFAGRSRLKAFQFDEREWWRGLSFNLWRFTLLPAILNLSTRQQVTQVYRTTALKDAWPNASRVSIQNLGKILNPSRAETRTTIDELSKKTTLLEKELESGDFDKIKKAIGEIDEFIQSVILLYAGLATRVESVAKRRDKTEVKAALTEFEQIVRARTGIDHALDKAYKHALDKKQTNMMQEVLSVKRKMLSIQMHQLHVDSAFSQVSFEFSIADDEGFAEQIFNEVRQIISRRAETRKAEITAISEIPRPSPQLDRLQNVAQLPAYLLPKRSEAQVQTFVDLIQTQRESKTIYLRLSEAEIDGLNDVTRPEVRQFFGTLAGLTSLNHRIIIAVPSEEAERDFNKRFDSFRLNERIKVPAQAILTAQHFDQEGASLIQAIGKQRVSQVYFLTEISEAVSLAPNVSDQTKLIVTDRVIDGGLNAVRTSILQKARLTVEAALLRRDAFQVTGAQNNIFIPNKSVFENLISSLTNFRQATLHILTQA